MIRHGSMPIQPDDYKKKSGELAGFEKAEKG
jgi:hypothetical protein